MFTFSEDDYEWCRGCSGSIRKNSTWCRFCREAVGTKFFEDKESHAFITIESAARWLPQFNSLILGAPEIHKRVQESDAKHPAPTIGIPEGAEPNEYRLSSRNDEQCGPTYPEPAVLGFVWDVLLALHANGANMREICDHPKLQLLEITPQEILAEFELRQSEIANGKRCGYCTEYIFVSDDEACRFCEAVGDQPPKQLPGYWQKTTDVALLREVLLYEAALRTINGGEPLNAEILSANNIDAAAVDREVLKLRSNPDSKPMTRWLRRMIDLKLKTYYDYRTMAISDLVDLSSSLKENYEVKLIVLNHALERGLAAHDEPEARHELGRVYDALSWVYREKDDLVKAKEYKDLAQEAQTFGMDEETKAMILEMQNQMSVDFDIGNFSDDPEQRLLDFEKQFEAFTQHSEQMSSIVDALIPGFGTALRELTSSLNVGNNPGTRARMEGDIAKKNGDYDTALAKYRICAEAEENGFFGVMGKVGALRSISEVLLLQQNLDEAEATLKEAIAIAEEYTAASPESASGMVSMTHRCYANFLRDEKRFEEAEREYQIALKFGEKASAENIALGAKEKVCDEQADGWADYSVMLERVGRPEEASQFKTKSEAAKQAESDRKAKLAERRKKEKEAGL